MSIDSVMIVDDSAVQCQFAVTLIEQLLPDAKLSSASNGQEALEKLQQSPVHLLLVDLEMPVMDGVELLAEVSEHCLAKAAIVLSSQDKSIISSVGLMAKAKGLRVLASLQKPINEEQLSKALENYTLEQVSPSDQLHSALQLSAEDVSRGLSNGEFVCHFQPKLTAGSLMVKGVEALARWNHPEHGFISPAQFIPIAEENALIDGLTFCLLEYSLARRQEWMNRGLRLGLAFNFSPGSLHDPTLVSRLTELTQRYSFAPKDLTLEITENALITDLGESLQTLARLRLLGFNIAIDDYGTGFANAEQLSLIPATELKLDRSIVNEVSSNPQLEIILRSTVNLAKELNLLTVAEGVEGFDDYQRLQMLGVDLIQGFYFARPMAAETLVTWIHSDLASIRGQIKNGGYTR